MSEIKKKSKGGRPVGSGNGEQIIKRIRMDLFGAFKILERKKKPLHVLLADQLEVDASKTLNLLGKYMPSTISLDVKGNEFSNALSEVALRMKEIHDNKNKNNRTETIIEHDQIAKNN
tara:strand:- start:1031 stop:1384 length:354 start_codon:yes stop_codon:yes gene_type:complete